MARKVKLPKCDQCESIVINGLHCHEHGCPNSRSRYDAESGQWIKQRECFTCGYEVDADDPCCDAEFDRIDAIED